MLKNYPFLGQISNLAISGLWFGWGPNPICQGTYPMGRLTPMMKNLSSQFWPIPAISTIYRATPLNELAFPISFSISGTPFWETFLLVSSLCDSVTRVIQRTKNVTFFTIRKVDDNRWCSRVNISMQLCTGTV